jgi:hypothetical protein
MAKTTTHTAAFAHYGTRPRNVRNGWRETSPPFGRAISFNGLAVYADAEASGLEPGMLQGSTAPRAAPDQPYPSGRRALAGILNPDYERQ